MRKAAGRSLCLTLILLSLPAVAQQASPYSLTFDMRLPPASAADSPGPLSLAFNPAELAWGDDFEMYFLHQQQLRDPQGETNFSSAGADGLLLRAGWLGLGFQWVRPLEDNERYNYLKTTLAMPLLFAGRWFSLGAALELLDPTDCADATAIDFSAGALVRPFRYISLGVVGRNLGRSSLAGVRSNRILDLAVAVRPLWIAPERVRLAADLRLVDGAENPPLRFSGWFELLEGVSVFGSADLYGNFGVGLAVDFMRGGAGGYVEMEDGTEPASVLLSARMSTALRPGLKLSKHRTALVRLDRSFQGNLDQGGWFSRRPTFWDADRAIRRAARDERVDSLLLRVDDPELAWSQVEELRDAIFALRSLGKKVVVHLRDADNASYYLACAGDHILLDPGGGFFVNGPTVEALFLGGALQMIGVRPEYERVGDYKNAVDMLTNDEPSAAHREVLGSMADELDGLFMRAIAEGRHLGSDRVRGLVERGPMSGEDAVTAGLVDGLSTFGEGEEKLAELLGHRPSVLQRYLDEQTAEMAWGGRPRIAVVSASGSIAYRSSFLDGMDAQAMAELVERLREDTRVDAVVLRVDSPGGDGSAADMLWQQLKLLREKKPLVVSMGRVAASGGYYISAPADVIVAEPSTITGSIGVFALLFDLSELYADLGISKEVVKRSRLADFTSTFRARSEEEMEILKKTVQTFYRGFISKVAEGRKTTPEEIDKIGQGRVWTGRQAKDRGLVDELGGLHRAVEIAKQRLGLGPEQEVDLVFLPRPHFSLGRMASLLGFVEEEGDFLKLLDEQTRSLLRLASFGSGKTLAMMPMIFSIR